MTEKTIEKKVEFIGTSSECERNEIEYFTRLHKNQQF